MTKREIIICQDGAELSRKAAEQFVALAGEAGRSSGRFAVALSGGSTPRALYALLGSAPYRERIDWRQVHLFWGDERCVPPDHPESNYRMVREALLSKISLPEGNIHRVAGEKDPPTAAADYEKELRLFFDSAQSGVPRFDLVLLGLGEDGHTASLFTGSAAVNERQQWAATAYVVRLKAHRLTLTLPVINAAAQVTFLVSGQSKSAVVKEMLGKTPAPENYPAAQIAPADGRLTWLVTADAAAAI